MVNFDTTKYKRIYVADFETSTEKWGVDKARVWLWDICDSALCHKQGTELNTFMEKALSFVDGALVFFHNLAYDGVYILQWLLEHGYKWQKLEERTDTLSANRFFTCISGMGQHYCYTVRGRHGVITFADSFKTIHFSVKSIAEMYNLPIKKGEIDYDMIRPVCWKPTDEEIDYIKNDTEIVMRALQIKFSNGETGFTQTMNAKASFRATYKKQEYKGLFPEIDLMDDKYLRRAYSGGFTYLNPKHAEKDLGLMVSLDCNSMYPAQMLHRPIPYGYPRYGNGEAHPTADYPLYVQRFTCLFDIKDGHVPTISERKFRRITSPKYVTSSDGKEVELTLCTPAMELFLRHYHVYNFRPIDYMLFQSCKGVELTPEQAAKLSLDEVIEQDGQGSLFYEYFKKWRSIKEHNKGAIRTNAKLMQNALYGALATNPDRTCAIPELKDGRIQLHTEKAQIARGFYLPAGLFITAYAQEHITNTIQANYNRFVYCDTDSVYLLGQELPNIPIHPSLYGFFKIEHYIEKARFLGAKRYIYYGREPNGEPEWTVSCCGADMPVKEQMTWENFHFGSIFDGKKTVHTVKGGKHIATTTYKLSK